MPSQNYLTLVLPEGVGLVSRFNKAPRSFVRIKNGSLGDGNLLLQLTLKQLVEIRRLSKKVQNPNPELFKDAKSQYDDLLEELGRLEQVSQSTSIINILKRWEIRRETRALVEAGYDLYVTTRSTSDRMQRAMLSRDSLVEEVQEEDIPPGAIVRGFSINGTDEEIRRAVESEDPFTDPTPNQTPSQNTVTNIYIGCVNADRSNINGGCKSISRCYTNLLTDTYMDNKSYLPVELR